MADDELPPRSEIESIPLQFDRVEPMESATSPAKTVTCQLCHRAVPRAYYEINGKVACASCRGAVERTLQGRIAPSVFLRATWMGSLAAVLGAAIYFGVRTITGYEIGLIAVIVGALVGGAVRRGSGGRGGWQFQALAIALTYSSIVSTYMPPIYEQIVAGKKENAAKADAAATDSANKPADSTAIEAGVKGEGEIAGAKSEGNAETNASNKASQGGLLHRFGIILLAMVLLFALAAVAPIWAGVSNLMGLVIIGIALYEAWKFNKRVPLSISGPYRVGSAPDSIALTPTL